MVRGRRFVWSARPLRVVVAGLAGLLVAVPAADAGVLKTVPGTVTAVAADGTNVAYVTNINSKSCRAPIVGDRQQVVYLNARTRRSVLLTTVRGCRPSRIIGGRAVRGGWLGVSGMHAFWVESDPRGAGSTRVATASPGHKPVATGWISARVSGGGVYGPLVAAFGKAYVNRVTMGQRDPVTCSSTGDAAACKPVVTADEIDTVNASGGRTSFLTNPAPRPQRVQAVDTTGVLLLALSPHDPGLALASTSSSSRIHFSPSFSSGTMDQGTVVGLGHLVGATSRKQSRLSYFSVHPSSAANPVDAVGFCAPGARGIVAIAQSRHVTVFSTARTLWALHEPEGIHDSCYARRLVSLPATARIGGFALSSIGGLVYASNSGHTTVRGTITRISRSQLRHLGFIV